MGFPEGDLGEWGNAIALHFYSFAKKVLYVEYLSLMQKIGEEPRDLGDIWNDATLDDVVFQEKYLKIFDRI